VDNTQLVGPGTRVGLLHLVAPVQARPDESLGVVAGRMTDAGLSLAVLSGPGEPAVVSERDLVRALAEGLGPESPVGPVATRHPVVVAADTSLRAAADLMLAQSVRHLLVVDSGGRPVGVLSAREALRTLLRTASPDWGDS